MNIKRLFGVAVGSAIFGTAALHYDMVDNNSTISRQNNAIAQTVIQEMSGKTAKEYLSSHGFTSRQSDRFEECAQSTHSVYAIRRCMKR